MIKLDARRLTGINVIWQRPGAVVDLKLEDGESREAVIDSWHRHSRRLLDALEWPEETSAAQPMRSGVSLAISAPMDQLYAAVEVAEWIAREVAQDTGFAKPAEWLDEETGPDQHLPLDDEATRLRGVMADEANPALQNLLSAALANGVTVLSDDDEVSIGLGRHATTWPVNAIPATMAFDHAADVPVALVTGTNGKTTTVRLSQRMLRAAGLSVGISSTDWIGVDDRIIDRGDYSGPGGARAVLRQPIDCAVLETARGGLLRRGLGVPRADVALITNIAEDHLGDFGSENLGELLNVKWVITQALDQRSIAVLNAEDELLAAKAPTLDVDICWFSTREAHPLIQRSIAAQQPVTTVRDGQFARFDGHQWTTYCRVEDAPLTVQGSARHNIANALGAIALSHYLGASDAAIGEGLTSMQPNDNPGRCNFFNVNGVHVLLDFAHNPSAMQAIFDIAAHHPAPRRLLCFGQAGDRTDRSIRELGEHAWAIGLDRAFIAELADYRRGRPPNEVYSLLKQGLQTAGAPDDQIIHCDTEQECLEQALTQAQPGDLIIMLALAESRAILQRLNRENPSVDD